MKTSVPEQYFPVVMFIVVLYFESVDEILEYNLNLSCRGENVSLACVCHAEHKGTGF